MDEKMKIVIKSISILIIISMLIYDISWACPPERSVDVNCDLQVQSIFRPIKDRDIEINKMLMSEILFAARLALRGKDKESINRTLNRWIWKLGDSRRERILRTIDIEDCFKDADNISSVTFRVKGKKEYLFRIKYEDRSGISGTNRYDKLSDIYGGAIDSLTITDLTDKPAKFKSGQEGRASTVANGEVPATVPTPVQASIPHASACVLGYDKSKAAAVEPIPNEVVMDNDAYLKEALSRLRSSNRPQYDALNTLTNMDIRFSQDNTPMDRGSQLVGWFGDEGQPINIVVINNELAALPKDIRDNLFHLFLVYLGTIAERRGADYNNASDTDRAIALLNMARAYSNIDKPSRLALRQALSKDPSYTRVLDMLESRVEDLTKPDISADTVSDMAKDVMGVATVDQGEIGKTLEERKGKKSGPSEIDIKAMKRIKISNNQLIEKDSITFNVLVHEMITSKYAMWEMEKPLKFDEAMINVNEMRKMISKMNKDDENEVNISYKVKRIKFRKGFEDQVAVVVCNVKKLSDNEIMVTFKSYHIKYMGDEGEYNRGEEKDINNAEFIIEITDDNIPEGRAATAANGEVSMQSGAIGRSRQSRSSVEGQQDAMPKSMPEKVGGAATQKAQEEANELMQTIFEIGGKAEKENSNLIIGIDTSWVPATQQAMIQTIVRALEKCDKKEGIRNVVVVTGNGHTLATKLAAKVSETGTPLKNVVVLAGEKTFIGDKANFDKLKGPEGKDVGAFFAVVDPSELTDFSDAKLVPMLKLAARMASGEKIAATPEIGVEYISERLVRMMPRATKIDPAELPRLYDAQRKVIESA